MTLSWFVHHKRFGRFKHAFNRQPLPVRPLATFPRIIHLYWDQGLDGAPAIARRCVRSWAELNPGWELRIWDHDSASEIVSIAGFPAGLKLTPYSDILRTELLRRFGGVWADATVWCTRPLDEWLLQVMAQTDFFAFARPGPDRAIASWFLASRPQAQVVTDLASAVRRYWAAQGTPTRVYHWFQYLFEYLERTSGRFRREWRSAPVLNAAPLLALQIQLVAGGTPSPNDLQLYRALPMHKLTHKQPLRVEQLEGLLAGSELH